jgi:hypothetical protein
MQMNDLTRNFEFQQKHGLYGYVYDVFIKVVIVEQI